MSERNLHKIDEFSGINIGEASPDLPMNRVDSIVTADLHNLRGHPKPKIRYQIMDEETYAIKIKNC